MKETENESFLKIKRYVELVKHLELERDQVCHATDGTDTAARGSNSCFAKAQTDKTQYFNQSLNLKNKLDEFVSEYNDSLARDREAIESEFHDQIKKLNTQVRTVN
jgi:hypothetical protein